MVWGSRLPAPEMRYTGYVMTNEGVTFYGDGIRSWVLIFSIILLLVFN